MAFTNSQKMNLLDAKDACVRLLMERRTKGRFVLYTAISDLCALAMPVPPYPTRKALRASTLAVR